MREFWHSDVAPGPLGGSSPGTSCRKSLPCLVGLTRGGCLPAAGRFRPNQWRERADTCAGLSGEWCRADCGQWWPAKVCDESASSLGVPSPFPLRGAHCGPQCPAW